MAPNMYIELINEYGSPTGKELKYLHFLLLIVVVIVEHVTVE